MAKTTAALTDLAERRLPFVSVLADPTMGGVSASFAMIGDVVIAEPKALIGFAGPRVIEQTVRQKLPEGFQRAEFLLEKGAIDMIVDRRQLRDKLHSAALAAAGDCPPTAPRDPARRAGAHARRRSPAPSSRLAKTRLIADCLRGSAPDEIEIAHPLPERRDPPGQARRSAMPRCSPPRGTPRRCRVAHAARRRSRRSPS